MGEKFAQITVRAPYIEALHATTGTLDPLEPWVIGV